MVQTVNSQCLAKAICRVMNIDMDTFVSSQKSSVCNLARGLYCMLSREYGIHPNEASSFIGRSRSLCINSAKSYLGYYETGDKEVRTLVDKIKNALNNE